MNLIVDIFGKSIEIHKDMPVYFSIRNEFLDYKKRLLATFEKCNIVSRDIDIVHEKMQESFEEIANDVICKLSEYDIYDKTKKDLIDTNVGYGEWLTGILKYYEKAVNVQNSANMDAQRQISKAEAEAQSSITGLSFGILTSDILSLWIYDSMNESEVKRQTRKAQEDYNIRRQSIQRIKDSTIKSQMNRFVVSELEPMLKSAIDKFVACLLSQYVNALDEANVIDLACIEGLDEAKALEILQNLSVVSNKKGLIAKSIELCPYHLETYVLASQNKIFSENIAKIIRFFNLQNVYQISIEREIKDITCGIESVSQYEVLVNDYCSYLASVTRQPYENIIINKMGAVPQDKMNDLKELVINAACENSEDKAIYLLENQIKFRENTLKQDLITFLSQILNEADMVVIEKYFDKNLWNTVSDWANTSIVGYKELQDYLVGSFDACINEYETIKRKQEEAVREIIRKEEKAIQEKNAKIREEQEAELKRRTEKLKAEAKVKKMKTIVILGSLFVFVVAIFLITHRPFLSESLMKQYMDAIFISPDGNYFLCYNGWVCEKKNNSESEIEEYNPFLGSFILNTWRGNQNEYQILFGGSVQREDGVTYTRYDREPLEIISIEHNSNNDEKLEITFVYKGEEVLDTFWVGIIFIDEEGNCNSSDLYGRLYEIKPNVENKIIVNDSCLSYEKIVVMIANRDQ